MPQAGVSQPPLARHSLNLVPEGTEPSLAADTFKAAFREHPAGVAVVTADPGEHPVAMTVSSLASVSTEPPLLVFSASVLSSSTPVLEDAETVVVHFLTDEQLWLAKLGADKGADRFADASAWQRLPTGEPLFPAAFAWIRGRVAHRLEAGNSILYVVHALEASVPGDAAHAGDSHPLVYHDRTWHRLGPWSAI
ncbi:flavin reductase [Microbacterium lushaniae]|nr:flavin reductase [Microbacterium lushaniae]KAA9159001.1 flavin reductase [Microbacterium lushaniae]